MDVGMRIENRMCEGLRKGGILTHEVKCKTGGGLAAYAGKLRKGVDEML